MRRNQLFLTGEQEAFGPGIDLVVSLTAILLIVMVVGINVYRDSLEKFKKEVIDKGKKTQSQPSPPIGVVDSIFKASGQYFSTEHFRKDQTAALVDRDQARLIAEDIVEEYRRVKWDFPYLFIIGHLHPRDEMQNNNTELKRKSHWKQKAEWLFSARRASVVSDMIKEYLTEEEKDRMVIVSAENFALTELGIPLRRPNVSVEVVFGKEWR